MRLDEAELSSDVRQLLQWLNSEIGLLDHDKDAGQREQTDQGWDEFNTAQQAIREDVAIHAIDRVSADHADSQTEQKPDHAAEHQLAGQGGNEAQAENCDRKILNG